MKVIDPAHEYVLGEGENAQTIKFIKKIPHGTAGLLRTVHVGTTNEETYDAFIARIKKACENGENYHISWEEMRKFVLLKSAMRIRDYYAGIETGFDNRRSYINVYGMDGSKLGVWRPEFKKTLDKVVEIDLIPYEHVGKVIR